MVEYHEILDGNRKGDNDNTEMYLQSDGKMIAVSIYFNFFTQKSICLFAGMPCRQGCLEAIL